MNKDIQLMRGLTFFYFSTNAVLLPFLPLFFEERGYSTFQIGLLMMIGPFVSIFFQPMWGYASDRWKKSKLILYIMWGASVAATVFLFETQGFALAFLFALLLYFFINPSSPLLDSLIIKTTQAHGVPYGNVRMFGSLGFTSVAFASGWLLMLAGGVERIHYIYLMLWIVPFILLAFLKDDPNGPAAPRITLASLRVVALNRQFLWFLFLVIVITIPHRMNDSLFTLYLAESGGTSTMIGMAWAIAALSEVPTFALLGRYLHRFHELALLGIVSLLYSLRWLAYALADDPVLLMFLQAAHSITYAVFWMAAVQYTVRLIPPEWRSTGQSLLSAAFLGLAGLLGGMIGGWIDGRWGGAAMYVYGSVQTLLAGLLFFATHLYYRRKGIV